MNSEWPWTWLFQIIQLPQWRIPLWAVSRPLVSVLILSIMIVFRIMRWNCHRKNLGNWISLILMVNDIYRIYTGEWNMHRTCTDRTKQQRRHWKLSICIGAGRPSPEQQLCQTSLSRQPSSSGKKWLLCHYLLWHQNKSLNLHFQLLSALNLFNHSHIHQPSATVETRD